MERSCRTIKLADLERRSSGCPRVLSILDTVGHPLPLVQRYVGEVQLCLRLDGSPGEYRAEIDGTLRRAGYPHLLVKRGGAVIRHEPGGWCSAFCIALRREDLPAELEEVTLAEIGASPELAAALNRVRELLGHSGEFGAADRIDRRCAELVLEILLAIDRRRTPPRPEDEAIRRALSHLQLHFMELVDYDEVARRVGCSPRSFRRHWRRVCGGTPGEFVSELRFAEARRLLTETGSSLAEIALRLHYREVSNFCTAFKRRFGVTPRKYRLPLSCPKEQQAGRKRGQTLR